MEEQEERTGGWTTWQAAMRRREAGAPTPVAATMLSAVLLAVAAEIGRAQIGACEVDALVVEVRARLAGVYL